MGGLQKRIFGNRKHHSELRHKTHQSLWGKKESWRGKVESVMWPETGSLGHKGIVAQSSFHGSKGKKRWHSTTAIKILAMTESKNKNKTTIGRRFQNNRGTVAREVERPGLRLQS